MKTTLNEKENLSTDTLLVGSGGINPGIFTYCTESGEVRKILELSLLNIILTNLFRVAPYSQYACWTIIL